MANLMGIAQKGFLLKSLGSNLYIGNTPLNSEIKTDEINKTGERHVIHALLFFFIF